MPDVRLFNRLALRIAIVVGGVVGAFGYTLPRLDMPRWALALALALVAAGAAYAAATSTVARRLELARATLRQARKRRFDGLAGLRRDQTRDELDELIVQVYRAGRALQQEIERLEKLENYRREFLGNVSHELRTPIFAVSGFAENLLDGAIDDARVRHRFVEKILSNAHRLDTLTRDLSDISRMEMGELRMVLKPFSITDLIVETVESLEGIAAGRQIAIGMQLPPSLPAVLGDRERIGQVLANLIENAVKYNETGGHLEVTARRVQGPSGAPAVRVAVVDDGLGVPAELIPRLTERFFRVDKSRSRQQGGTGLGLAIVKHILEAHGQRLHVDSQLGYGSTFSFLLLVADKGAEPAGLMHVQVTEPTALRNR